MRTARRPSKGSQAATASEASRRRWAAPALLALSVLVAAATAAVISGFLTEYGTTTGSRTEGAGDALKAGAMPLVVVAALAAGAFGLAGGSLRLRVAAAVVPLLAAVALAAGGAQAASAKYGSLPTLPRCGADDFSPPISTLLHRVDDAFAEIDHPSRFSGGGSSGYDGCDAALLDVTFEEASSHYRDVLPEAGWVLTRGDSRQLRARRGDLVFALTRHASGELMVGIKLTPGAAARLLQDVP